MPLIAMTLLVLLLAFVNRPGISNPVTTSRIKQLCDPSDRQGCRHLQPKGTEYTGRMLGVTCECTLTDPYASLHLWGVPIGGHLSGTAWFKSDGRTVVLDPELAKAVSRRMTTIYQAHYRPKDDTVHIVLAVPIVGVKRMVLHRKQTASSL